MSEQSNYVAVNCHEKCLHEKEKDTHGATGVASVASAEDRRRKQDHPEGGLKEDRSVLAAAGKPIRGPFGIQGPRVSSDEMPCPPSRVFPGVAAVYHVEHKQQKTILNLNGGILLIHPEVALKKHDYWKESCRIKVSQQWMNGKVCLTAHFSPAHALFLSFCHENFHFY